MNPAAIAFFLHSPGPPPWKAQMQGHLPGLPFSPPSAPATGSFNGLHPEK